MKCSLCRKESENYLQGTLSEGIRVQVEKHLNDCSACAESFALLIKFNEMIQKEKTIESSPFLSTRVMAEIEALEHQQAKGIPAFRRVLRPVVIGLSIAAAVFFGIFAGTFYNPSQNQNSVPEELSLFDDSSLEYVESYTN